MAAYAELMIAARNMLNAVEDETAALEAVRGMCGADAAKAAESRVVEASEQLRTALASLAGAP